MKDEVVPRCEKALDRLVSRRTKSMLDISGQEVSGFKSEQNFTRSQWRLNSFQKKLLFYVFYYMETNNNKNNNNNNDNNSNNNEYNNLF